MDTKSRENVILCFIEIVGLNLKKKDIHSNSCFLYFTGQTETVINNRSPGDVVKTIKSNKGKQTFFSLKLILG